MLESPPAVSAQDTHQCMDRHTQSSFPPMAFFTSKSKTVVLLSSHPSFPSGQGLVPCLFTSRSKTSRGWCSTVRGPKAASLSPCSTRKIQPTARDSMSRVRLIQPGPPVADTSSVSAPCFTAWPAPACSSADPALCSVVSPGGGHGQCDRESPRKTAVATRSSTTTATTARRYQRDLCALACTARGHVAAVCECMMN